MLKILKVLTLSLFMAGVSLPAMAKKVDKVVNPEGTFYFTSQHNMTSTITEADVAWASEIGTNTIYGTAIMPNRKVTGGGFSDKIVDTTPLSCASASVSLIPKTAYADERMMFHFGNLKRGYIDMEASGEKKYRRKSENWKSDYEKRGELLGGDNPIYVNSQLEAYCDIGGGFVFDDVADGDYYVVARIGSSEDVYNVNWARVHSNHSGGLAMQQVKVRGGRKQRVVLNKVN